MPVAAVDITDIVVYLKLSSGEGQYQGVLKVGGNTDKWYLRPSVDVNGIDGAREFLLCQEAAIRVTDLGD